jgi:hypothetical protein
MSTKNNPGAWDCYAKAHPDEPMFVLLARDPLAPDLVREWARRRSMRHEDDITKIAEALCCADEMAEWRLANPPEPKP